MGPVEVEHLHVRAREDVGQLLGPKVHDRAHPEARDRRGDYKGRAVHQDTPEQKTKIRLGQTAL